MKGTHLLLAFVSMTLVAAAQADELIVDGNFETPYSPAWMTSAPGMIGPWGAPGTTGNSLNLSSGGPIGSFAMQVVDLSHYQDAVLSFDLTTIAHGPVNSGSFAVGFADGPLDVVSVGSSVDGFVTTQHVSIAITDPFPYMGASPILFGGVQDASARNEIFVDNVSIQAQAVPEPGSFCVLGIGGLALLRRRRA